MSEPKPQPECPGCRERDKRLAALEAEVAKLRELNEELRRRLGLNSTNSSKPPSTDTPEDKAKRPNKPTGKRKRGGQEGRKGSGRKLLPPDQVHHFVAIRPTACRHCGGPLSGKERLGPRHQVTEWMHDAGVQVTEYQCLRLRCAACKRTTVAELPAEHRFAFGPRLTAVVALLTGQFHLSKRQVVELLLVVFRVSLALGSVSAMEKQASQALEEPHAEVLDAARQEAVTHADETSWPQRHAGRYGWLWILCSARLAAYLIQNNRDKDAARNLVGEAFCRPTVTDRFSSYKSVLAWWHQFCWAHLLRDFEAMAQRDKYPACQRIGEQLVACAREVFKQWRLARAGPLSHEQMREALAPVRQQVSNLLEQGTQCGHADSESKCRELKRTEDHLWVFLDVEGMEPDNNLAERLLRTAVIWRKVSFCTDSYEGSRFVERILTAVQTLRLQGRNALTYLTEAITAWRQGRHHPSLLPA